MKNKKDEAFVAHSIYRPQKKATGRLDWAEKFSAAFLEIAIEANKTQAGLPISMSSR